MSTPFILYGSGRSEYGQIVTESEFDDNGGNVYDWRFMDAHTVDASAGVYHVIMVNSNGEMYGRGQNYWGTLGQGEANDNQNYFEFTRIGTASNWVSVSCGEFHTVALNENGELWGFGRNHYGQIDPDNPNDVIYEPVRIGNKSDWVYVAPGWAAFHTIAIDSSSEIFSWGRNTYSQTNISGTGWVSATAGWRYSAALNDSGELWVVGNNRDGQLGLGDYSDVSVLTRVGTKSDWVSVTSGGETTVLLNDSGEMWAAGANDYGSFGLGEPPEESEWAYPNVTYCSSGWTQAISGDMHTLMITPSGELWGCGQNWMGQLGIGWTGDWDSWYESENYEVYVPTKLSNEDGWMFALPVQEMSLAGRVTQPGDPAFRPPGEGDITCGNVDTGEGHLYTYKCRLIHGG